MLCLPGSHALVGGRGGEGRATVAKVAARMQGVKFFSVPDSPGYDR